MQISKRLIVATGVVAMAAAGFFLTRPYFSSRSKDAAASSGKALAAATAVPAAQTHGAHAARPAPLAALPPTREFNPLINPYAGALREPGKAKRAWDADFLKTHDTMAAPDGGARPTVSGDPISFELCNGRMASGTIKILQRQNGELSYLSGELSAPEQGKFFFLTPPPGGKAGKAVGVVEFPLSSKAYRIEPTGPGGEPELWERRLDEVICMNMPPPNASVTNQVAEMPPLRPDTVPDFYPSWNSNIISLQSYPGSSAVLLLDFFGGYTPTWNGITYARPGTSNSDIKDLWKRVAEDFMPFNINVTTDIKVYLAAPANSRQRCCFTTTPVTAAGVAYIGSWNWGSDTPCWSVYNSGKAGAEVGAHEPGHTLGLGHQGQDFTNGTPHNEYFAGHGSAPTGWAPTMGAGYYQPVTSWSKSEYESANNHEDELNMIVSNNNNVDYRPDDTGATLGASRYLELYSGYTASAEGVIEQTGDTDAFQFTTTGGAVSLTANPVGDWASLAVMATLADASDTVIASNNPQNVLTATISTNLPAGTYTFRVTGAGRLNPQVDGFTSYASLGYYSITGTVAGARLPNRFAIAERSTNGTVVGTIPAVNTNANPLAYAIVGGNSNNTFAVSTAGVLTVANSNQLDYESLALTTVFPVRFEMFVNITNTVDPAQTELNRRVVVLVTNINEAPALTGFTISVLEHTQSGTSIGQVTGADPDFYTSLLYYIASGNSNSMFAINATNGTLSVSGDLNLTNQAVYNLKVAVSDQTAPAPLMTTSAVTVTVLANTSSLRPGTISYANYDNIGSGTAVSDLTNAAVFPRDPTAEQQLTLFEGPSNRADNYGAVIRGYVIPPASGSYTFWIASDDSSQLWLSGSTNPAAATLAASVSGSTGSRQWTKFGSQQSAATALTAGRAYYIEARMKEGGGNDNLAVAWQCTAAGISQDVIPGRFLAPYFMNYVPHATGFTCNLHKDAITGARLGTVAVTDVNTNDGHSFAVTGGNTDGLFSIDANSGVLRVANDAALLATSQTSYSLQVQTTDNGTPPLSGSATVTVNLVATNAIVETAPQQEIWNNIGGGVNVSDLTGNARFPGQPDTLRALTALDGAHDYADNYGSRIRAYLRPTNSGAFTFFIASDDASQLKLSMDTNPANASVIASVAGWTDYQVWTANASQKSAAISVVAGQSYYLEALHKEGGGGDHVSVAWTGPGIATTNVIDSSFLAPVDLNYPPVVSNQTATLAISAANGAVLTTVAAVDSSLDTLAYKIVSGNTSNTFVIDPDSGRITLANPGQLPYSGGIYSLVVEVQDSGYGGRYPLKSTQAVVTAQVTGTNWPPVVALTAPADRSTVSAPITLAAAASDPDNNLSRVEFYVDGAKAGQVTSAPYNYAWTPASAGLHSIYAVAVDSSGLSATSALAHFTVAASLTNTLIAVGSVWKYFDRANDLGTSWRSNNYNELLWGSGPGMLGFGDANGILPTTTIANNGEWTAYFRRTFVVPDASLVISLNARMLRDDGAVVYINGTEVWRDNMPAGIISNTTPASSTIGGVAESTFIVTNLNPAALVTGTNLIAVEVHQVSLSSSDIDFDFGLADTTVIPPSNAPPYVVLTSPPWGTLLAAPGALTLEADAEDYDGSITNVEFFSSGALVGQTATSPYQCAVTNLPAGVYMFTARATDNRGGATTSDPVYAQVLNTLPVTIITTGSVWKYLDNGSDQGTAWRNVNFDDSSWHAGRAQLGYGDGDEATAVGYGTNANNKYITTYFRCSFMVQDAAQVASLASRLLRDDGAVAYLNGVEFFRNNMPAGPVNYLTLASSNCADDGTIFFPANIDPALLLTGANVIAVEIHQYSGASSDISFDFELTGAALDIPAARLSMAPGSALQLAWPAAAGSLNLYTTTELTPPVKWIAATNQAALVNGQWVITLSGSGTTNRFYRLQGN